MKHGNIKIYRSNYFESRYIRLKNRLLNELIHTKFWSRSLSIAIALLPFFAGALFAIDEELGTSIYNFFKFSVYGPNVLRQPFHWEFLLFSFICIFWIFLTFISEAVKNRKIKIERIRIQNMTQDHVNMLGQHLTDENNRLLVFWQNQNKNLQNELSIASKGLVKAIHFAPNPNVFAHCSGVYNYISYSILKLKADILEKGESKEPYETAFKNILESICFLTSIYEPKNDANHSANIMIYIDRNENPQKIKNLIDQKQLMGFDDGVEDKFFVVGILEGRSELRFAKGKRNDVPVINLPIIKESKTDSLLYIPGACKALNEIENVIPTTNFDVTDEFQKLDDKIKDAVKKFFTVIANNYIKSVVSFKIPVPTEKDWFKQPALGVLNIDCNMEYIIGEDKEYNTTYFSLLKPIVNNLSLLLNDYIIFLSKKEVEKNL